MAATAPDHGVPFPDVVAVYGTLRRGGRLHERLGTATGRAHDVGHGWISGDIYEVTADQRDRSVDTSYPCLRVGGAGRVHVELYRVLDAGLWPELDELEGFVAEQPDQSEYVRQLVHLCAPTPVGLTVTEAWAYVYVRAAPDVSRHIAGGDWIASRSGVQPPGSSYL